VSAKRPRAGIGFREHTGWAAMVVVGGPVATPTVLVRRRVELFRDDLPGAVFHAAAGLESRDARDLVARVKRAARSAAAREMGAVVAELRKSRYEVVAAGIPVGGETLRSPVAEILASHAKVHAAEGELYREALAHGADRRGIPVVEFGRRELVDRATVALGVSRAELTATLADLGRTVGAPWRSDQKDAATAALLALATG
jgi:hypothetical protein